MNYSVVKQFFNHFIDSIYNLFFKIIDFFKILGEAFLVFLEVWEIFFSIFLNLFLYFYYLFLFSLDRSLDTNPFPKRGGGVKERFTPQRKFTGRMFSSPGRVFSSGIRKSGAVLPAGSARISRRSSGAKRSIFKDAMESIADFFTAIFNSISGLFKKVTAGIPEMKSPGKAPQEYRQGKGLIDEYLKEYEQTRKI